MKAIGGQPQLTSNAAMDKIKKLLQNEVKENRGRWGGGGLEGTELNKSGLAGFS